MSKPLPTADRLAGALPPSLWFVVSAIFHYLGPSFAVLLFPAIGVLGVAWLRIGSAALFFLPWAKPWRLLVGNHGSRRGSESARPRGHIPLVLGLGLCLAGMNCAFYLALARLPMSLVAAMEFLAVLGLALYGLRSRRNAAALGLAFGGVALLLGGAGGWQGVSLLEDDQFFWGLIWSGLNAILFGLYIVLGHRAARQGAGSGLQVLGAAMTVAFIAVWPVGLSEALRAFDSALLLLAAVGVGLCSSVLPYICDLLVMSRSSRSHFAVMLSLLPATATALGAIVLAQWPGPWDLLGVGLVMLGVALHQPSEATAPTPD
ncbi:MAG: EamA family transporter [Pseudomonadota bacterium]